MYLQYWGSKSADVDVFLVDVIWQGIAAPYAVDLNKFIKTDIISQFFPHSIENNTVKNRLFGLDPLVYRCWTPLLSDRSTREVWIHGPTEDVGRAG